MNQQNNEREKWVTVIVAGCSRRRMPESKIPKALETIEYMKELGRKAGTPEDKLEQMFSYEIVRDDD